MLHPSAAVSGKFNLCNTEQVHIENNNSLITRIMPFLTGLYAGFVLLFTYLRVWPLAGAYLVFMLFNLWLNNQSRSHPDRPNPRRLWAWGIIFAQSVLAVWMLGTDAGFQFYLLATIPPGFANLNRPMLFKLLQSGLIILFFLACDSWLRGMQPLYPHSDQFLTALRHLNTVGSCVMLSVGAYVQALVTKESRDALNHIASTDALTGLYNRRRFAEIAEREFAFSRRSGHPLTIALGDIDFFKRINDSHGHAAGDQVLQTVAKLLESGLRDYDCIARWGGEEFVMLLPDTDVAMATAVVERLRVMIADSHQSYEGVAIPVTMTIGVAQFSADESWHDIVMHADEALYRGKTGGRNRVEIG